MSDIIIRKARSKDTEAIYRMACELVAIVMDDGKFRATVSDFSRQLSKPDPVYRVLLAEQENETLGFCGFFPSYSSYRGKPGVYVQDLYVGENVRGTGLGKRLLGCAVEAAQAWGACYLRLAVDVGNTPGQAFYKRIGMHRVDDDHIYMIEGNAMMALASGWVPD